jgi:hypothetical protein
MVGEDPMHPCTCSFRYCSYCFDGFIMEGSKYLPAYNLLVDKHLEFDPTCPYNIYLRESIDVNDLNYES